MTLVRLLNMPPDNIPEPCEGLIAILKELYTGKGRLQSMESAPALVWS